MSIRDKILSEQKENIVEQTAAAEKLKGLLHKLDKKVVGGVVGLQNFIDPGDAKRREKEGPDTFATPPAKKSSPKRPGEDRRSTTEEIEKLAEMLGKGVERHRGTNVPRKYSKTKGGTEADRKRLGRKAREGEEIVRLSRDLRAKISTDEAVEDMTPAQERDRDHKDNATRKTVAGVKLPSTDDERKRYAKDFRVKRGYGKGVGNKQGKFRDLMLKGRKTSTEEVEVTESEINKKDLRFTRTRVTDADERARRDRERESNAHERDKVRSTTEELLNVAEDMVTEAKDSYEVVAVKGNKVVAKMPAEKMDIKDAVAALTKMHGGSEVQVHKNGKIVKMKG